MVGGFLYEERKAAADESSSWLWKTSCFVVDELWMVLVAVYKEHRGRARERVMFMLKARGRNRVRAMRNAAMLCGQWLFLSCSGVVKKERTDVALSAYESASYILCIVDSMTYNPAIYSMSSKFNTIW